MIKSSRPARGMELEPVFKLLTLEEKNKIKEEKAGVRKMEGRKKE